MSKILVISHFPSHPPDSGGPRRIYNFLTVLKKQGHKVHFLFNRESNPFKEDIPAMKKAWDKVYLAPKKYQDKLSYINSKIEQVFPLLYSFLKKIKLKKSEEQIDPFIASQFALYTDKTAKDFKKRKEEEMLWKKEKEKIKRRERRRLKARFPRAIGNFGIFLKKKYPDIYKILKNIEIKIRGEKKPIEYELKLDKILVSKELNKLIKKIKKKEKFDIILAEYIFQTKTLKQFPNTLKVVDTHDAITSKGSLKANPEYNGYTNKQEAKALNRADIIIAIQEEEEKFFKKILKKNKKVVTIGNKKLKNQLREFLIEKTYFLWVLLTEEIYK